MSKPRVAVIGAGYFGRFHHEAWSRMPEVQCAASVDTNTEAATAAATDYGFAQTYPDVAAMLKDSQPDIIDITSPPSAHFDLIKQVAQTGAAVQCQKPFCTSLEEAREAVKYIADNKLTVSIHENFRFQPWHRQIKSILEKEILNTRTTNDQSLIEVFGLDDSCQIVGLKRQQRLIKSHPELQPALKTKSDFKLRTCFFEGVFETPKKFFPCQRLLSFYRTIFKTQ